jgi:hypothetical protein
MLENLEPGLRIQTQRRLTALEADLAHAEKRNIEKKNGGKYHMVKFFGASASGRPLSPRARGQLPKR